MASPVIRCLRSHVPTTAMHWHFSAPLSATERKSDMTHRFTEEDLKEMDGYIRRDPKGNLRILVAHCNHCRCVVIGPSSDECSSCQGELHPVSKWAMLGAAYAPNWLSETS